MKFKIMQQYAALQAALCEGAETHSYYGASYYIRCTHHQPSSVDDPDSPAHHVQRLMDLVSDLDAKLHARIFRLGHCFGSGCGRHV
jgi:hypothetical protein